jgi:mannose-6-phosphate isomerase, class I
MKSLYMLENPIQPYPWGSTDGICKFTGIQNPDHRPMAELWMGAHPGASSRIASLAAGETVSLESFIAESPVETLGKECVERFGRKLPFLFKVLSAAHPLSLQVHPSKQQAHEGFLRENGHIPLFSPERNYKDDNHKPELLMALEHFVGLCGFRPPRETAELFSRLQDSELRDAADILSNTASYTDFLSRLFNVTDAEKNRTIASVKRSAKAFSETDATPRDRYVWQLVNEFASQYPLDSGILAPLFLNLVILEPGEAIYIPTGVMHSYIRGTGLELMAVSDNVLRCGLTPKHVDTRELLSILEPSPYTPGILNPSVSNGAAIYRTPCSEFQLSVIDTRTESAAITANTPSICIVAEGELNVETTDGEACTIHKGTSFFIPASGNEIRFGRSGILYRADVPLEKGADLTC